MFCVSIQGVNILRRLLTFCLLLALSVQGVALASQTACHARSGAPVQQASDPHQQLTQHTQHTRHTHHRLAAQQHHHALALEAQHAPPDLATDSLMQHACTPDTGCNELLLGSDSCVHHCAGFALHAWVPLDFSLPLAKPVWVGILPSLHGNATPRGLERPPRYLPA